MNLKEIGVSSATKVCRFNTSNEKRPAIEWWREQIGEGQCLAHLHDGRIFSCHVKTQNDLYKCADFETYRGKRLNLDKRFR